MKILGISQLGASGDGSALPLQTDTEATVARLWREVLKVETLGRDDHFFVVGGSSIGVAQVAARVREAYGVDVPLDALFRIPTVAGMAAAVDEALERAAAPEADAAVPLVASGEGDAPLTPAQERMWMLHRLDPDGTAYTIAGAVRLKGQVDAEALEAAFGALVQRHHGLRTRFVTEDGGLVQRLSEPDYALTAVDLRAYPEAERETMLSGKMGAVVRRPFNLESAAHLRTVLYRLADDTSVLLLTMPHIVGDAWSLGVLLGELSAVYGGLSPEALPPLEVQMTDVARWQRQRLESGALEPQRAYWLEQLAGVEPLDLPTDRVRPREQRFEGAMVSRPLAPEVLEGLRRVSQANGATLFMTLLAAFQVFLHRWTGSADVAVGVPIAGRETPEMERLVGLFLNTIVLRADLAGNPRFEDALSGIRETVVDAFANQAYPFAELIGDLHPERDPSRPPLVSVMFNHINVPLPTTQLGGVEMEPVDLDRGGAQFELVGIVTELAGMESLQFEYPTALFDAATMERLLDRFHALLVALAHAPEARIGDLPVMPEDEARAMLTAWTGPDTPLAAETAHELVHAQSLRTPDRVAVRDGEIALTHGDLDARAEAVAVLLRARGLGPGDRVALHIPRGASAVVALLGVLKSGAAYVPLDPGYPASRLAFMLEDSGARLVLTAHGLAPLGDVPTLTLAPDGSPLATEAQSAGGEPRDAAPEAAYVLYTSGSTGQPKGVIGLHRGIVNRIGWMEAAFPWREGEVAVQKTALSFVDSVWEILGPLAAGVPLHVVPPEAVRDPAAFVDALAETGATRVVLVPSLLRAILDRAPDLGERLPRLTLWTASGEPLAADLAARFARAHPTATLLNLYGSTEVSADVTAHVLAPEAAPPEASGATVPIGRAISNTQLVVVDGYGNPVPAGVPGELLVGGAGVAGGYHARPGLSAERFASNPIASGPVFRTGDRVVSDASGSLRFLGRVDRQVKVRGVRVDPAGVEAVLSSHPDVSACAVVPFSRADAAPEAHELAAYVVLWRGDTASGSTTAGLRDFLASQLPSAAVPTAVVLLDALPQLPNGKLDRGALPEPLAEVTPEAAYEAPQGEMEKRLASVWQAALGVERVGRHDDFFDLGGHSLLAAQIAVRIEAELGVSFPLVTFFHAPTVAQIAERLSAETEWTPLVALQPEGERPPLFCVHSMAGHVLSFRELAHRLGPDQPFYGIEARGIDGRQRLATTIEEMAVDYIREIRSVQPAGPYYLAGSSFGGAVAFEMAQQLQASGETVGLLALLDSRPPLAQSRLTKARQVARHAGWRARVEWRRARSGPAAYVRAGAQRARRVGTRAPTVLRDTSRPDVHRRLMTACHDALMAYRVRPYRGNTVLFRTAPAYGVPLATQWSDVIPEGLRIYPTPGTHNDFLEPPHVEPLAKCLMEELKAAQNGAT
ncbi:amino acid adenylation domain-containing protein [Rubricoccus marinus]|uniref:Carrier domain-containing protein n=1 Tax=Rubricoccus marinus TaxID=716817 RepID=A0A259U1N2_9BACT|nr:non-ribosomal peptide synthetase [Rubricoccus marinus]OZC03953.1 hypothetical protein BSZ36_13760 [Rubricoccus marinus]